MRFTRVFILCWSTCFCTPIGAQEVPFRRYTTRDGMFTEKVTCIAQDQKGYMWFGTYFGVMRYDGYQWQKIELPESMRNKFVSCITTSGNKVYAGFLFGGGLMEWHEGKVRKIPLPIGYTIIKYLVTDTDGSILICAAQEGAAINHGVWRYSDQGLKSLWRMKPGHVNVSALSVDHKGRIWIGTAKGLLILNKNSAVDSSISEKPVSNITRNADETMMVCYESKNSLHLDFYSTKSRTAVIQKGWAISDAVFPYLAYNPYNGAWGINTNLELIHTEEKDKSSKFQFDIPQKTITGQLFIDRERNIWLSTEVGTYKFYNLRAQSYRFDERGPSIASISSTGRKKLFSNGYSLFRLRNGSMEKIPVFKRSGFIGFLFEDSYGSIWISQWTDKYGIWKTEWKNNQMVRSQFFSSYNNNIMHATDIYEDSSGIIWVAGGHGISLFQGSRIIQHVEIKAGDQIPQIIKIAVDEKRQTVWLGTNGNGLLKYKYVAGKNGLYQFTQTDNIENKKGLGDNFIRGSVLLDSKGAVWIGTRNNGLIRLTENEHGYQINNITEKEGILCSKVNNIKEYGGFIWVATCNGVYKLADTTVIQKFDTGNGLMENDVIQLIVEDNILWTATAAGITRLEIQDQKSIQPITSISEVRVLGIPDTSIKPKEVVRYSSSQNSIGFVFTANSFIDEQKVIYSYKLEGYDQEWSDPTASNQITFASLAPGDYTFKVKAQNAYGVWSNDPAVFSFKIILPFYRTVWFYMVVIFVLLLGLLLIRIFRILQKYKIEKLRGTIARDLHDEIGSALGTINILSRTAQRKLQGDDSSATVVNKIGATAQQAMESIDEIIWTINPVKEKTIDLVIRMQNFAQPLFESEGIQFSFTSGIEDHQKLDMMLRRDLYLIYKELIYNTIRHSGCTVADVKFFRENKLLVLEVWDNGMGFDKLLTNPERNGLKNIKNRVSALGGNFYQTTEEGKGTRSIIKIPAR